MTSHSYDARLAHAFGDVISTCTGSPPGIRSDPLSPREWLKTRRNLGVLLAELKRSPGRSFRLDDSDEEKLAPKTRELVGELPAELRTSPCRSLIPTVRAALQASNARS